MKIDFSVDGLKDVTSRLSQIPGAGKAAKKKALRDEARATRDDVRRFAPEDTGRTMRLGFTPMFVMLNMWNGELPLMRSNPSFSPPSLLSRRDTLNVLKNTS